MMLTETKGGILIEVYVKPNSPKFEVLVGDEIVIRSAEEPERGKVNKEIIKEFTRLFHAKTTIVSGLTSREKTLLVAGVRKSEAARILGVGDQTV